METFGQKLAQAIEGRGKTLEEAARQTGIELRYLEALRKDDYDALPENRSVIEGLRALAKFLAVDPDQVIEDYLRARDNHIPLDPRASGTIPDRMPDIPESPDVTKRVTVERSDGSRGLLAFGAVVAVMSVAGLLWLRSSALGEPRPSAPATRSEATAIPEPVTEAPEAASAPVEKEPIIAPVENDSTPTPVPPVEAGTPASPLDRTPTPGPSPAPEIPVVEDGIITAYGVGTRVRNHELVGETDRFAEGTSAWFWTRVEGAKGEPIRHVWIHEGEEVLSVPLRIGGDRWRTHSYKNLHRGSVGHWVVEARDRDNRVLARESFDCYASSRR